MPDREPRNPALLDCYQEQDIRGNAVGPFQYYSDINLRDLIAMHALTGLLAWKAETDDMVGKHAYLIADKMLEAREE